MEIYKKLEKKNTAELRKPEDRNIFLLEKLGRWVKNWPVAWLQIYTRVSTDGFGVFSYLQPIIKERFKNWLFFLKHVCVCVMILVKSTSELDSAVK